MSRKKVFRVWVYLFTPLESSAIYGGDE